MKRNNLPALLLRRSCAFSGALLLLVTCGIEALVALLLRLSNLRDSRNQVAPSVLPMALGAPIACWPGAPFLQGEAGSEWVRTSHEPGDAGMPLGAAGEVTLCCR